MRTLLRLGVVALEQRQSPRFGRLCRREKPDAPPAAAASAFGGRRRARCIPFFLGGQSRPNRGDWRCSNRNHSQTQ